MNDASGHYDRRDPIGHYSSTCGDDIEGISPTLLSEVSGLISPGNFTAKHHFNHCAMSSSRRMLVNGSVEPKEIESAFIHGIDSITTRCCLRDVPEVIAPISRALQTGDDMAVYFKTPIRHSTIRSRKFRLVLL